MDDEKLKLNKLNIILIIIDVIIFFVVILSIVLLVNSFKDEGEIPQLEVTKERTSTSNTTTTTEYVPTTTTTTTRRNLNSPYYSVDPESILTDSLFNKKDLTSEEALTVMKSLYETADKIFNISDNSLLDIATTIDYAKENEKDVVTFEEQKYGIIYNSDALLKRCFVNRFLISDIYDYRYNYKRLFIKRGDDYYRLENTLGNVLIVKQEFIIVNKSSSSIEANMRYYKSNYKEMGYSSPVYQIMNFRAVFEQNRWKLSDIDYPLAD